MKSWLIINGVVLIIGVIGMVSASFLWLFVYALWFAAAVGNIGYGIWMLIKKNHTLGFKILGLTLVIITLECLSAVLLVLPMLGHSVGE